jgi:hypothetical protein
MGNQQKQYGVFVGEKIPGESRILKNNHYGANKELVKDFNGMATFAEVFE